MRTENNELRAIVNDFENCGEYGGCEKCKCYEILNGKQCNICELLLTYRKDVSDKITELIEKM